MVRAIVAAPVPHYYSLLNVAREYHSSHTQPPFNQFQVPALFELLSGTRIGDLMNRIPALAGQDDEVNGHSNGNGIGSGGAPDAGTEPSPWQRPPGSG